MITRKPYLNLFFALFFQSISLLGLLLYSNQGLDIIYATEDYKKSSGMQQFVVHIVILSLISLISYITFFIIERRKASKRPYLGYLKFSTRFILTFCILLLNVACIILFCVLPGSYEKSTMFVTYLLEERNLVVPLITFVLFNLSPFIFFKPRP